MTPWLMPLHWGRIQANITVSGGDPASGVVARGIGEGGRVATSKSGATATRSATAKTKLVRGSGGTSRATGSGGVC